MFELRASGLDDADGVLRVLAARDLADFAVVDYTREELLDQWRTREFDPGTRAVVAENADGIIGYAAICSPGELAFVAPDRECLGVGTALLSWTESRARELGRRTFRQRVAFRNDRAQALLLATAYRRARAITRLGRRLVDVAPSPPAPAGISLAPLDVYRDAEPLHEADGRAFAGNPDYELMTLASFYDEHLASPNLAPELSRVARRRSRIVGFVVSRRHPHEEGFVDLLAVDPAERGRGLGTALLLTSFKAFAEAGLTEAYLEVASDNPVGLRVYARAGMTPRGESAVFEKPAP
jgi:mycothiol synthase